MPQKAQEKASTSTYARRNLTSIPAPLDSDSDPDFNSGAFVPEPTKKGRKSKKADRSISFSRKRGHKKRRSDVLDELELSSSSRPKSRNKICDKTKSDTPNALLEFFDVDLGLHSASEDEESDEHETGDEEDKLGPRDETDDLPIVLKTFASFRRTPPKEELKRPPSSTSHIGVAEDDSATESEVELQIPPKRKSSPFVQHLPPPKRLKAEEEDSATESETDEEAHMTTSTKQAHFVTGSADSDSTTESESESELPPNPLLEPRPNLHRSADQRHFGPLVLDRECHVSVPASINTYLREYQREGVRFFWDKYKQGRGGLLGDDMGLVIIAGKTIQVISFLSAIMKKHGDKRDIGRRRERVLDLQDGSDWEERRILPPADVTWPTCLIIAPSTVVLNWEREFQTWGYFDVGMYVGTRKERDPVLRDFTMGRLDIVLTSFDIARNEMDLLLDLPWSCVIVDEVHRVKNPASMTTKSLKRLKCLRRFGLTGTTIQNDYMEMHTILDWTNPERLGSRSQWRGFVTRPLTIGQSTRATPEERSKSTAVALTLRDKLLPHFFLRRTKDIIKSQLPTKTDQVVFCPLTPMQIAVYKRILGTEVVQDLLRKDEECDCDSGTVRKRCCHPVNTGALLKYMSILIKISNHLALILPSPLDSPEQTGRNRELADVAFPGQNVPKYGSAMLQPQFCGKWGVLETLLNEWRKDRSNKVLIFTKSVKLLYMIEYHLNTHNYGFLKLHGGTKHDDRMPMIDRFHQDPDIFIFLISTLAGGTGLNLTGANKVVIFDPNWNPAHDLQAMDRAYRFGQTRDVYVYRLLGAGSIEELIYARQLYKQQQMKIGYDASIQTRYFQGVQSDTTRQGELFGIQNIFKLHEDTLATKMAIENASLAELDWALAHMSGGRSKRQEQTGTEDWVYEADAKAGKEESEFRGLGALLFDDNAPAPPEENDIEKTLNAIGVKYSHRNDDVLVSSRIEQERAHNAMHDAKRRTAEARKARASGEPNFNVSKTPEPTWPPKRRHHKAPPSPQTRLASRRMALIELGMINGPTEYPSFAQNFSHKSREEQNEIFAKLDEHVRNNVTW